MSIPLDEPLSSVFTNLKMEDPELIFLNVIDTKSDGEENKLKEESQENPNNNNKKISCELCDQTFENYNVYILHLAKHGIIKNGSSTLYKCYECGKEYKQLYGLKYHILTKKGIKNHKCTFEGCQWSFVTKHALQKHIRATHSDLKPLLCSACGKTYSTVDALSHHEKSHSQNRSHKCDYCNKIFMQSCHLKMHVASHEEFRAFVCESCGRSYSRKEHLKEHLQKYCARGIKPLFKFKKEEKHLPCTDINMNNNLPDK